MPPKSFRDAIAGSSARPPAFSADDFVRPSSRSAAGGSWVFDRPAGQDATAGERATTTSGPLFDFYIVLDFEATCEENVRLKNQEIIEFPMAVVDTRTMTVVAEFQRYVRPVACPNLSAFCTELTGITQATVSAAQPFPVVWSEVLAFLRQLGVIPPQGAPSVAAPKFTAAVVTCGDWDLKTMLPAQMRQMPRTVEPAPLLFTAGWINLKNAFTNLYGKSVRGMPDLLAHFRLPLVGRHHSGIDDVRNITAVLLQMLKAHPAGVDVTFGKRPAGDQVTARPDVSRTIPATSLASDASTATASADGGAAAAAAAAETSSPPKQPVGSRRADAPQASLLPFVSVDCDPSIAQAIIASSPPIAPSEVTRVSKRMTQILRHGALEQGYPITINGFVDVDAIVKRNHTLTLPLIAHATISNDKQRLALGRGHADGRLYIRANQGHSIEGMQVEMKRITAVTDIPMAVHGTDLGAWDSIRRSGLNRMGRNHIHFAIGLPGDSGVISGMRKACQVLIFLDVAQALADGIELLLSANGVVLSPGLQDGAIPVKYFSRVISTATGASLI